MGPFLQCQDLCLCLAAHVRNDLEAISKYLSFGGWLCFFEPSAVPDLWPWFQELVDETPEISGISGGASFELAELAVTLVEH